MGVVDLTPVGQLGCQSERVMFSQVRSRPAVAITYMTSRRSRVKILMPHNHHETWRCMCIHLPRHDETGFPTPI